MSKDRELKIIIKADGSLAVKDVTKVDEAFVDLGQTSEKTAKELNKTTSAIDQIGSRSKQAKNDVAGMGNSVGDAGKKASGSEGSFGKLGQSLKQLGREIKDSRDSWSEYSLAFNQSAELVEKGLKIINTGWDMAKQGAQLAESREAFDDFAGSIGQNSSDIINKLRTASGGTINEMGLIATASRAMSLGVTQDSDKLANLLEIARNKARLFGIETGQAFEDIVTGIGRNSPLILDNLGIRIPAGFEEMTKGMSDANKMAKLLDLTLKEGNKQLVAMGGMTATNADQLRRFEATLSDLKTGIGETIAQAFLPTVEYLTDDVIPALKNAINYYREFFGLMNSTRDIYQRNGPAGELADKMDSISGLKNEIRDLIRLRADLENQKGSNESNSSMAGLLEVRLQAVRSDLEAKKLQLKGFEKEYQNFLEKLKSSKPEKSGPVSANSSYDSPIPDKELNEAKRQALKAQEELEKLFKNTNEAIAKTFDVKLIGNFEEANKLLMDMTYAAGGFAVNIKDGSTELGNWLKEIEQIEKKEQTLSSIVDLLATIGKHDFLATAKNLAPDGSSTGAAALTSSMMDFWSGGLMSSQGKYADPKKAVKDIQEPLSKTIAEAVSAGFANADFSNLELTLGNVLSSILTKSVSQSNPVISSAGAINWGNLGINLAASAVSNVLTRSGRFFGGREEHGKEAIQQASDLKSRMGQTYVDSYVSEITSIYATRAMKDAISNARLGYYGTSTGYTWSDSGDGIFSDRTRTYAMIDNGASAALKKLTDAVKTAKTFSENEEAWINLQAAKGYEFGALQAKVKAYEESLTSVYFGQHDLRWSDGTVAEGENLTRLTREIEASLAEMQREFALATAERSTNAAAGFAKYAPWLQNISVPIERIPNTIGGTTRPGSDFYLASVAGLSRDGYYDAFESLQNNLSDRNISSGLIDMVKDAGTSRYELESLKFTDNDAYQEQYLAYVERQISAYEEILERQDAIFADESKAYEERVAALEAYEQNLEAYHQAKLDKLRLEKAQEEEEKRLMAEQRQSKIEGLLSWVGEVNQQGNKVVVLYGNDTTAAIEELMAEHADDPQLLSVLKGMLEKTQSKARWG